VQLMTLHSAKGLEFPCVYMVGMEEDVFPSGYMNDYDEIEEERRLAYVGITRAKEVLTLTNAWRRLVRGEVKYLSRSRFVEEIPPELTTDGRRTGKNAVTRVSDFGMGTDRGHDDAFSGLPKAAAKTKAAVRAKPVPKPKPSPQMPVRASKSDTHLAEGDVVRHKKFGEGTVKEVVDAGKDYIVTVDFNNWGTRKLYASLAKLEKVE
ncbi:MAG: 3'-5' exonuclease, partial [Lachnospiraceae bacterium]|nr:3'-5' exonuclease [Lachnospiraceae bacterium]